jgi:hypothetical protein
MLARGAMTHISVAMQYGMAAIIQSIKSEYSAGECEVITDVSGWM